MFLLVGEFRENIYNAISSLEENSPFANILTPINTVLSISTSKILEV